MTGKGDKKMLNKILIGFILRALLFVDNITIKIRPYPLLLTVVLFLSLFFSNLSTYGQSNINGSKLFYQKYRVLVLVTIFIFVVLATGMFILIRGLFKKKQIEKKLTNEKEFLEVMIQSIGDGVIATDLEGKILIQNKMAERLTGWDASYAKGKSLNEIFKIIHKITRMPCENLIDKVLQSGQIIGLRKDAVLIEKDGTERIIADSIAPIKSQEGNIIGVVLVFRDVTEQTLDEEEIKYLSFHDQLTGLYNRAYFEEQLVRLDTERQLPLSIIIGDVNGLKLTNDVFGHEAGDRLLKKTAEILTHCSRQEDTVSRWGGDEFVIILPKTSYKTTLKILSRIRSACTLTNKDPIQPSIALGSATKEHPEQDIRQILKEAENKMYSFKLLESRKVRRAIISSLNNIIFEKGFETREHVERMKCLTNIIGEKMKLTNDELGALNILCLFYNIGIIVVNDSILMKPEELTYDEWEEIKKHPETGYRIAESSYELAQIANQILSHHEKWDGTGYPHNLKGKEIPILARILTVVDAYDVMTNGRPYKKAISHDEAVKEIRKCSGTQFDPEIVNIFIRALEEEACTNP